MDDFILVSIREKRSALLRSLEGHKGELVHARHKALEHERVIELTEQRIKVIDAFLKDNGESK